MADYTYGNLDPRYVDAIRQFEGFTPRAKWDVRQNSNGYGTRARYPGEVIDKAEAERRLHEELTRAAGIVDSYASNLDPGTRAALASLTYNSGGDWMKAGLGQAVKAGDWDAARQSFGQYTKSDGQHIPGLAIRRNAELGWFGAGAGATQPAQGQPQPGPVQATYPFPAPMALGAPREPVQAPSEVLAQNYGSSGTPQPSSAPQWDTGAFWAGKAAESKADGGSVPTADEILAEYSDPVGQFHHKLLEQAPIVPPWDRPGTKSPVTGTLSNPPDRPSDWAVKSGVAETVSPTMGAYGVGSILGEVAGATKAGNLGEAGMNALPLGAMFLGPGAKTANKTNMLRAQEMHAKGLPREAIWKDTGWFQGVDGKWRYEIDDSKSFTKGGDLPMSESANRWGPTAGGVVHHPDMMAAYPEIADVHMKGSKDAGGSYASGLLRDPVLSVDDQLRGKKKHSVALHEFQHGVQDLENFASGANENFGHKRDDVHAAARDAYNANREAAKRPPTADDLLLDELGIKPPNVSKPWEELTPRQQLEWSDAGRGRLYRNSAGEVEARTVQKRMNMTPEERAARPPWLDYDVPEGQQIVRYGDGGPQASASVKQEAKGIRAYHGSPHDFDKFDINKIGTGEGAQAYGHGLYFAENEGVAKSYRENLSPAGMDGNWRGAIDSFSIDGKDIPVEKKPVADIAHMMREYKIDPATPDGMDWLGREVGARGLPHEAIAEAAQMASRDVQKSTTRGRMYEVKINADPEHFLDWDKPLSQQSEKVRNALQSVPTLEGLKGPAAKTADALRNGVPYDGADGASVLAAIGGNRDAGSASKALREAGIPGIRYLDQGSRSLGDGSRNYVVFDPTMIEIMRKYGLIPPLAVGAGAAVTAPATDAQPLNYANGGAVHRALKVAEKSVNRTPSDAQKEAGNYAKGHLTYKGLNVTIENPKGSERSGMGRNGKRWSVKMPAAYGYVKSTEGYDGDHVDVYLGPDHDSDKVFVVDQIDAETGKFDEHKCMLSFANENSALDAYNKAFSDGRAKDRIGSVTEMTMDRFKSWVKSPGTKVPLGDIRKGYADGGPVPTADEPDEILAEYTADRRMFG